MSKLEKLIQQYCPDGVEWKTLYSITKQFSGMTGVSNKWAEEGNCVFIDYNNVYNHTSVDTTALKNATVKSLKQNTLRKGDILFTSASETPDECALSSVIEKDLPDGVFLDDHLFGLRLLDEYSSVISPSYLKYAFRSEQFRFQIRKVVRGATRHYVSKVDFMKLEIPVPPLPVQEEIVRVLDAFTELQAELQKRKQQYNFYRDNLLSFEGRTNVQWMKLGDVAYYVKNRITSSSITTSNYVSVENLLQDKQGKTIASNVPAGCLIHYEPGDVLIGNIRPYLKKIWLANGDGGTNGDVLTIRADRNFLSPEFLYQCLASDDFFQYDMNHAKGAKMPRGSKEDVMNYKIPITSLSEQQKIVSILDRFDTLTNDLTSGLPAEMEKRRQQYEFYRDKLLTFKRKEA